MATGRERKAHLDVTFTCPSCRQQHRAVGSVELRRQPVVFGGGGIGETEAPWTGPLTCPRTGETAEASLLVPVEDGEYVRRATVETVQDVDDVRPAGPVVAPQPSTPTAANDWIRDELAEWRKNSVATSRAFATTMLATSSGAVAVYFAVLKYLGFDTVKRSWGWVTVLPPVAFLTAAAAFAVSLRPALSYVSAEKYAQFRAKRVTGMYRMASVGIALYLLGLLIAVIVFFVLVRR